jgi:hypothetical protein
MAKKQKIAKIVKGKTEIEGIPFGILSLDDFLQAPFTQGLIAAIKTESDDPLQRLNTFLMSYQLVDIKVQLIAKGQDEICNAPEAQEYFFELATKNVLENYGGILAAIGSQDVARLLAMFTNDATTNE